VVHGTIGSSMATKFLKFLNDFDSLKTENSGNVNELTQTQDRNYGKEAEELIKKFIDYKFVNLPKTSDVSLSIKEFNKLVELDYEDFKKTGVKLNPFGIGSSGLGKTQSTLELFESKGVDCSVMNLSNLSKTNPAGFQVPDNGKIHTVKPSYFPKHKGVLVIDEFTDSLSEPSKVGLVQQLTNPNSSWAEYSLPNTYIVLLGNNSEQSVYAGVVPAPLKNRLTLIEVKFDLESTMNYFRQKGVQPEILGFMKLNPDLIGTDTSELPIGENFVTPRTLLRMSYFLELAEGNERILNSLAKGTLGTDAGEKFVAYLASVHGTLEVEDVLKSQRILKSYKFKDSLEGNLFVEKLAVWLKGKAEDWRDNHYLDECKTFVLAKNPFGRMEKQTKVDKTKLASKFDEEIKLIEFLLNQNDVEVATSGLMMFTAINKRLEPEVVSKWFSGFKSLMKDDGYTFETISPQKREFLFNILRNSTN